jgi:ATP-dependent helicase/nuclease subunit B
MEELSQSLFIPAEFEYNFGPGGDGPPMRIAAPDGSAVYFAGTIDRVDSYRSQNDGLFVRVIDYKSGAQTFKFSDMLYGLNLQMPLYLFAVTDKEREDGKYKNASPAGVLYMPAQNPAPSLERRETSGEDLKRIKNAAFKPKGLVLDDEEIIAAMDKNRTGIYLPVTFKKSGEPYDSSKNHLLDGKQLEKLRGYSHRLILDMADSLKRGKIPAMPLETPSPCKYCDYSGVCGHQEKDGGRKRAPDRESAEEMLRLLS